MIKQIFFASTIITLTTSCTMDDREAEREAKDRSALIALLKLDDRKPLKINDISLKANSSGYLIEQTSDTSGFGCPGELPSDQSTAHQIYVHKKVGTEHAFKILSDQDGAVTCVNRLEFTKSF